MKKIIYLFILFFSLLNTNSFAQNNLMILKLTYGDVEIELYPEKAPNHVKRFKELANSGKYNGVVFNRVIEGFMAQTGDVKHGNYQQLNTGLVGTGGSDMPNIPAEFNEVSHQKGVVSMARSNNPDSANSQFFICFGDASFLDGQYSAFGKVVEGMDIVDSIKKGHPQSGAVDTPDYIESAYME